MLNFIRRNIKLYYFLRKSHRSVGVFLVIFLLLLSITGVVLNHASDLNLSEHYVPSLIAARYYSANVDEEASNGGLGFSSSGQFYYSLNEYLFVDQKKLVWCGQLLGIGRIGDQLLALCNNELLLFTSEHQLIERIGTIAGIPKKLTRLSVQSDRLILGSENVNYEFDIINLSTQVLGSTDVHWPKAQSIPREYSLSQSISWQQFVLDMHSGIFFGSFGKWFADLVALCIAGMAVSGLVMWIKKH